MLLERRTGTSYERYQNATPHSCSLHTMDVTGLGRVIVLVVEVVVSKEPRRAALLLPSLSNTELMDQQ